jgi:predicted Rdx family selenoprotein
MGRVVYVVKKKKEYRNDWDSPEFFAYKGDALREVARANLADAIRTAPKLRVLRWGRKSSAGYEEAQEIVKRISEGIYEMSEQHVQT